MAQPAGRILAADAGYPGELRTLLQDAAPPSLTVIGDPGLLHGPLLALFCSVRCPGSVILQAYDLTCRLRDAGVPTVGGFQSPMEREMLDLLLRGRQPVVFSPARDISRMRLPAAQRDAVEEGRLLVLSPFTAADKRVTVQTALERNRCIAALAARVLVLYATPGGKLESLTCEVVGWGKPLLCLDVPENEHLVALGARPLRRDQVSALYR